MSGDPPGPSFFVGGDPAALLAASSALAEVAAGTDDVARRLAGALLGAASTILACIPFAPVPATALRMAVSEIVASPNAGLGSVFAAYETLSLQLRNAAQALEAAGVVGLVASGGLGLLRGERPSVLGSADGVDLRREAITGSWSAGTQGHSSSLAVREVRRPDGTTFFVVEATVADRLADSAGVQVNGVGGFVEVGEANERTLRWAVPTHRDAELLLAAASGALALGGGGLLSRLPTPTETVRARTASGGLTGGPGPVPGVASASVTAGVRHELTTLRSGGQRLAASFSGAGNAGLLGVVGTGGSASVKVTVERDRAGAVQRASLSTTTELDRGRHGLPVLEAGNREATLLEREWPVDLSPEARAAADRIAAAVARGEVPDPADVETVAGGMRGGGPTEHIYDVRHQQGSFDVAVPPLDGGAAASLDTATLRPAAGPAPARHR